MLKNILKVLFGNVFSKLYPFLVINLLSIYIDTGAVGVYAFYITITTVSIAFITGGIAPILVRYLAVDSEESNIPKIQILDVSIFFATVLTLLVSIILALFGDNWLNFSATKDIKFFIIFIILTIIGLVISTLTKSAMVGLREYNKLVGLDLFLTIVSMLGLIFTYIISGFSNVKYFLQLSTILALLNGLVSFIYFLAIRRIYYLPYKIKTSSIIRLFHFGWPALLSALMFSPVLLLGKFLLEKNHGLEAVGQFELAFQWATMLLIVTGVISSLALPDMASLVNHKPKMEVMYKKYLKINIVISLILSFLVFVFFYINRNGWINFFPAAKEISYLLLLLVLITALLISIWSVQTKVCAAFEQQLSVTKINSIWIIICVILMALVTPVYGVLGMMFSITISWCILIGVFFVWNKRFFKS